MVAPGAVVSVEGRHVGEDVEEDAVRREAVLQGGGVGAERGHEGPGGPAVALRPLVRVEVEPCLDRRAVFVKDGVVVGEAGGVWVVVDVVVVRDEEDAVATRGRDQVEEDLL